MTQKCIQPTVKESIVAKRFARILKRKTCKYMTSISKNVSIDKLDDIVNKCDNTCIAQLKSNLLM